MMRFNGIPYPSEQDLEDGEFDHLADGECSKVWRDRFLLDVDEEGQVVASPELQELWEKKKEMKVTKETPRSLFGRSVRQG